MKVLRTANAGVLLELDGVRLLLDGVSPRVAPYLETPPGLRQALMEQPLDGIVYTHTHEDHYDPYFLTQYSKFFAGPIMGPAEVPYGTVQKVTLGDVRILPVQTRHIGKQDGIEHYSYCIQGSRCVWFLGDATPLQTEVWQSFPAPDVMIVPYGFVIGRGWQLCKKLMPEAVVILHLPKREEDSYGLWQGVEAAVGTDSTPRVYTPDMEQALYF